MFAQFFLQISSKSIFYETKKTQKQENNFIRIITAHYSTLKSKKKFFLENYHSLELFFQIKIIEEFIIKCE